jgi:sugar lactone lactonase YvrE
MSSDTPVGLMDVQTVLTGLTFPEQPRWHEGRLWFSDWGTRSVIAVDPGGESEVVLQGRSFPMCVDWLADGRLLLVSGREGVVLCRRPDGILETYADLKEVSDRPPGNEMVVDRRGHVYVNGGGFDLAAGEEFAPGMIALIDGPRSARIVAGDLEFPNGMHIAADGSTLIVGESYGRRLTAFDIADDGSLVNRRVWADLGDGVPDGICMDTEGAVWYADVPNRRCVRVREGGEVLNTVQADRGCFACALGGEDRRTLFITANQWGGPGGMFERTEGVLLALPAPAPAVGWP